MIHIIFRTCDKVNSLHNLPRPFGLSKTDVIKASFTSILKSFEHTNIKITILGDELPVEVTTWFNTRGNGIGKLINEKFGNDASLVRMFELAEDPVIQDEDIIYFVEDDYLHFYHNAGNVMEDFFEQFPDFFYHPTDYPDQYFRKDLCQPSWIFMGKYTHFRQISSTTFTFAAQARTIKKHIDHMKRSSINADDLFLSKLYSETPCFCPIPGMATHLHEGTMSPFTDWEKILESLKPHIISLPKEIVSNSLFQ